MAEPICGDGSADPGEECDDANDIDGDGCNRDCLESGGVVWLRTLPTIRGADRDTLNAVVTLDEGSIVAGGSKLVGAPGALQSEANLVRLSPEDGRIVFETDLVLTERDDTVRGLSIGNEGNIYAVGEQDMVAGSQSSGWVVALDVTGLPLEDIVTSSVGARSGFLAVASGPGLVRVGGYQGDGEGISTHVLSYSPMLALTDTDESVGSNPPETQSTVHAVAMDQHGAYVAGTRRDGPRLRGFTTTSPAMGVASTPPDAEHNRYIWGLAIAERGNPESVLWSAGWTEADGVPLLAQLHRVSRGGNPEETLPDYDGAESEGAFYSAIVVDPAGDLIVAGGSLIGNGPNQFRPLVRRLDPSGAERWTRVLDGGELTRGAISGLALDGDGMIAACGHAWDAAGDRRRMVVKLRP